MKCLSGVGLAIVYSILFSLALGYSFDANVTSQTGHKGAVASENEACSHAGTSMLKKGGNAADAMVATVLCVGVTGLYNSGISGGGFALIRMPNNTYDMIDFREQAPASASENMFVGDKNGSQVGGNAIAIPGQIRGLDRILRLYGKLDWPTVTAPAIEVAEQGFLFGHDMEWMVNWTLANGPVWNPEQPNFFVQDPAWSPDFAPNGIPVKRNEKLYRKRYANTLRAIAASNGTDFYTGGIARSMLQTIRNNKGNMTENDLRAYDVVHRRPRQVQYRGYNVISTVAPSSGTVLLNILSVLNNYEDFFTAPDRTNISTHRMVEAIKFGYSYRNSFGDPKFTPNITTLESTMLSYNRTQAIFHQINDSHALPIDDYDPDHKYTPFSWGTSHMVTSDEDQLTISLTTTTNLPFGSHIMDPKTGIVMNCQMDDFSTPNSTNAAGFKANPNNFIKPQKRPLSSISPVIFTRKDGSVAFVTGAAGGSHIPSTVVQAIIYAIDQHKTPKDSLAGPRLHHQLFPNHIEIPDTYNNDTVAFLRSRNHKIKRKDEWSYAQSIGRSINGTFVAASEPRQFESNAFAV